MSPAEPFPSVAAAWFWTVAAISARRNGAPGKGGVVRPCDPDDVIQALDMLHRRGAISIAHGRVLRWNGERGVTPLTGSADARLWDEAMDALELILRAKGIVA